MKNDLEIDTWNGRALLTDLYQLTMAYGYWKSGRAEREAVFHLFFRKAPFQSGFTVVAGLATAIDFLKSFHFTEADLQFLSLMTGNDCKPLFEAGFVWEENLSFRAEDAMPGQRLSLAQCPDNLTGHAWKSAGYGDVAIGCDFAFRDAAYCCLDLLKHRS